MNVPAHAHQIGAQLGIAHASVLVAHVRLARGVERAAPAHVVARHTPPRALRRRQRAPHVAVTPHAHTHCVLRQG